MATKQQKTSAARTEVGAIKPIVPKIINVMDIKAKPKGMTLVHFTAAQWKDVTRKLKLTDKLPQKSVLVEAVPLPGSRGDMLVGGFCRSTRGTICYMGLDPIREAGIPPERFDVGWTCTCQEVPDDSPPRTLCRLRIGRFPRIGFFCDATNCPAGCDFRATLQNGVFQLGCVCRVEV